MNRNEQFLSLIGLCLRGRNLEVGEEPVEAVARARDARVILLAADAADNTARRVRHFAEAGQCLWLRGWRYCTCGAAGETEEDKARRGEPRHV